MKLIVFIGICLISLPVFSQVKQKFPSTQSSSLSDDSQEINSSSRILTGNILAYPTPCKNSFTLEPTNSSEIKNVAVVNILGKKVPVMVDLMSTRAVVTFDSGVPDGIYLCKVSLEKEILTIRMVKSGR